MAPEHAPFESVPTPLLVATRATQIVYANPACLALTGWRLEELANLRVQDFIDRSVVGEDGPWVKRIAQARAEGGQPPPDYWVRLRRADGGSLTVQVLSRPGPRAGERTYALVESSPEGEARRLTDALAAASWGLVHLREEGAVLEAAADALQALDFKVVIFRAQGDRLFHVALRQDPAARAELTQRAGAPIEQLPLERGQAREFSRCLEERRALFIQDTHELVDRFRPPELAAVIKAAMPRRAAVAPLLVEGEPYGVLTAQRDALSPAGVGAIELFAQQVGRALERVRLQRKLLAQERLATLGEAAAVLSHELRNPVGAILNAVAVLKRRAVEPEVLAMVEEESLRLDRLVRDLLHLARPLEPRPRRFDLGALAQGALAAVRGRVEGTRVRLELDAPVEVPALGDPFLLGLAVENLLLNAVQVSPPEGRVRVTVAARPEGALLTVDDQGPGVSQEVAARLFEPFFTTKATGTGLGLAVVRKVVEAHRGQVRAAPSPLGGARFEVELPGGEP